MLALPLAWSALKTRPARTFFSIFGIALGVATAIAILTLDDSTVANKVERKTETFAKVDLEVRPADPAMPAPEAFSKIKNTPGVENVGTFLFTSVQMRTAAGERGFPGLVALDVVARTSPAFDAYRIAKGEDLPDVENPTAPACLLGAELAEQMKLVENDKIMLTAPRVAVGNEKMCVDGEWVEASKAAPRREQDMPPPLEFKIDGILDRYHLGKQSGGSIIIIPFSTLPQVFGERYGSPMFWISKSPKVTSEELKTALTPTFAYNVDRTALIGESADERAFRNGVRVSGVLALLLGLFVIFHTLSMSLIERVREIAILNSIGATRGQIGMAFFVEAIMIATVGAGLGIGLGLGLARVFLLAGFTTLGRVGSVQAFSVHWPPIIAIASTGLAIAMAGSIFPLWKARSIFPARVLAQRDLGRPADLFRGMNFFIFTILAVVLPILYFFTVPILGEQSRETARVMVLGGMLFLFFLAFLLLAPKALAWVCSKISKPFERLMPLEGFLSARAMVEGIPRVATSAAVLALVGAALITIKGITATLRADVASLGETITTKVFVGTEDPIPRSRVEEISKIPGVVGFEQLGAEINSPFLIYGLNSHDAGQIGLFKDPARLKKFEEAESLILSTPLARSLKIEIGQVVPVAVPSGPPARMRVMGISDDFGFFPPRREYAIVSSRWMKQFYCFSQDQTTKLAVRVADGVDPIAVATQIQASLADFPKLTLKTGISYRDYELEDIDRDFRLFDLILLLVATLAGVGVLNALLLAAYERRKEIGVMKAIGMTRRQLAGTVLVEAATTGLVGGAFGLLLGLAFLFLVTDALSRLTGLPLRTIIEPLWLGTAFAGAVALAVVAAGFPILRANRFNAAEAVRYE
ncbi:MAG: FtsX-like permease family protein [Planctomycetes bacterium]|nr:FtsX-like permease family protein [Planctomycetota bacterium]